MIESRQQREMRILKLFDVVSKIPRNTTSEELKACFIEHVINANGGNRTQSSIELGIPYRTLTHLIYRRYKLNIPPPANFAKPKHTNSGVEITKLKTTRKAIQVRRNGRPVGRPKGS